jgi:kumamolisin
MKITHYSNKTLLKCCLLVVAAWFGLNSSANLFAGTPASQYQAPKLPVWTPECAGSFPDGANARLRVLAAGEMKAASTSSTAQYNTPTTIRSAYNLPSTGGSGAIAIVIAYHYPNALADFNYFSNYFSLPQETSTNMTATANKVFSVVYAKGKQPASGGDYIASWNLEAALDIQWAHAIAPKAKIYLVEAASSSLSDMYYAVQVASRISGVKEVSMSWGTTEYLTEFFNDSLFNTYGVVYLAAGGDTAATVSYPAASPNVVSCGGTTINRDSSGNFVSETGWSDTGCGPSKYEVRPSYQSAISRIVGYKRGTTDLSFVADANSGVYVYCTSSLWGESGWWILGGTSVSTPCLAGVLNLAATAGTGFAANSQTELNRIYSNLGKSAVFRDITSGSAGSYKCATGWDYVTGVGSPLGLTGK